MDTSDRLTHLLRRTGFAAEPEDIERQSAQGLDQTVEALVGFEHEREIDLIVQGLNVDLPRPLPQFLETLQTWWLHAMASTTRPLDDPPSTRKDGSVLARSFCDI